MESANKSSTNKLVSIVIPIYNASRYIERLFECIAKQTYQFFEVIYIDDGSTDDSLERLKKIKDASSFNIRIIEKENGGPGSARNVGLEAAKGTYLAFLDADDTIDSMYIETLFNAASKTDSEIVICDYFRVSSETIEHSYPKKIKTMNGQKASKYIFSKTMHDIMIVPWGKLFKTSYIKQFRFNESIKAEDEEISYKYIYKSNNICFIPQKLYYYYANDNSDSTIDNVQKSIDISNTFMDQYYFYENKSLKANAFFRYKNTLLAYFNRYNGKELRQYVDGIMNIKLPRQYLFLHPFKCLGSFLRYLRVLPKKEAIK